MSYVVEENEYEANEWYLIDTNVRNEYKSGILEASPDYYKLAAKASKLNAGKQYVKSNRVL
jgi:hypothetical protein